MTTITTTILQLRVKNLLLLIVLYVVVQISTGFAALIPRTHFYLYTPLTPHHCSRT